MMISQSFLIQKLNSQSLNTNGVSKLSGIDFISNSQVDDSTFDALKEIKILELSTKNKQTGGIKGVISDTQGLPLPSVNIKVVETGDNTQSDKKGNYSIVLPPRTYTIEVSYLSFQKQKITGILVTSGKSTQLNIVMEEATNTLKEVVVTKNYKKASAVGLYNLQKKTVSFTDGISADLIKQTPDNNVAQVLKRVSGVTMQDNKFIVVRGMSERYNNVLLNGSSLPSTEPNRKNFSFDIIPSNLIDNLIVAKTFTPDMSGEFAGGTVQVNTLSVPQEKFLTLSLGSGYNTQSFGKDFYSNTRYTGDYFLGTNKRNWYKNGFFDRYRLVALPRIPGEPLVPAPEQSKLAGELPNHWGLQKFNGNPSQNFAVVGGMPFEFKDGSTLGFTAAFNYRHEEEREDYEFEARFKNVFAKDGIQSSFVTVAAGLLNMGWKSKNHRIDWRNLYNRRFTHTNSRQTDYDDDITEDSSPTGQIFRTLSSVKENTLMQSRLDGEHKIHNKKLILTWFGDFNQVDREQPDDRFNSSFIKGFIAGTNVPVYSSTINSSGNGSILNDAGIYSSLLTEKKQNVGGNIEFSFKMAGNNNQKLKAGYWGTFRSANFKQNFLIVTSGYTPNTDAITPVQVTFGTDKFAGDFYRLTPFSLSSGGEGTQNRDNYEGKQNLNAGYIMSDFSFLKNKLHFIGGVRFDQAAMIVNTVSRIDNSDQWKDTILTFKKPTWLPSVTITYDLLPSLKLRAAYSKTLARADFRERSPVLYYDLNERFQVAGNEALKDPSTQNYDLRLEWYPSPAEIISVSAFRKYFINPIEILAVSVGNADAAIYVNLNEANVKGIEFNLRKHFGFFTKGLENLYLNGNASLLEGTVTLDPIEVDRNKISGDKRGRAPNGFAPVNWNVGLSYNLDAVGASVNYNYISQRIRYAGSSEYFDQYEAPRGTLDAQLSFKLIKNKVELKCSASDIIAQPFIVYMNTNKTQVSNLTGKEYNEGDDKVIRKGLNGTTYSFSIAYKF
jgi:TonB-dependent receptor